MLQQIALHLTGWQDISQWHSMTSHHIPYHTILIINKNDCGQGTGRQCNRSTVNSMPYTVIVVYASLPSSIVRSGHPLYIVHELAYTVFSTLYSIMKRNPQITLIPRRTWQDCLKSLFTPLPPSFHQCVTLSVLHWYCYCLFQHCKIISWLLSFSSCSS